MDKTMINHPTNVMDVERALTDAHVLYHVTGDLELKEIMDRMELCWYQWRDDSDYSLLMEKCARVMSQLF